MFGKKKERHKSGEQARNIEENGTLHHPSLNPGTSVGSGEQGEIIEGRDELTPETR